MVVSVTEFINTVMNQRRRRILEEDRNSSQQQGDISDGRNRPDDTHLIVLVELKASARFLTVQTAEDKTLAKNPPYQQNSG